MGMLELMKTQAKPGIFVDQLHATEPEYGTAGQAVLHQQLHVIDRNCAGRQ